MPADNLNLDRMIAKCGACHAVFAFTVDGQASPPRASRPGTPSDVPRPSGLELDRLGGDLTITKRWRSWFLVIFLSVFTAVWNGMSWFMFVTALAEIGYLAAFFALFGLVGLLIAYMTLGVLVNSTVVSVGREVVVRHGPLPMPGNCVVAAADLDQLYVTERVTHSSSRSGGRSTSIRYDLRAKLKSGAGVVLLRSLVDAEEALYFEQLIEAELGIPNEPVRGEV